MLGGSGREPVSSAAHMSRSTGTGWLHRLRERGVIRVAASYAVIAWLLLQIADVTFEPLGVPRWVMVSLIVAALIGFPVAVAFAWFYEAATRVFCATLRPKAPRGQLCTACAAMPMSRSSACC